MARKRQETAENPVSQQELDEVLRPLVPQVLRALAYRYGQFDACEDAVQAALLEASSRWAVNGVPARPRAWLQAAAHRRLQDHWRSDSARRKRELAVARMHRLDTAAGDTVVVEESDDTLTLLLLCCHPALTPTSQIALTLRAVGGLTTAQIAAAFLVPEPTIAQRISRAKRKISDAGARFELPPEGELSERLSVVMHVLYLIFNEGYTASGGPNLQRRELAAEAIRLTRELHRLLPTDRGAAGLLALMLLTDARADARVTSDGGLVPMAEQDRRLWRQDFIREGVELVTSSLREGAISPYQLQAAIAAIHAEAPNANDTDWRQIDALYELLEHMEPTPMVRLNRAVAAAMVDGADRGLTLIAGLQDRVPNHRFAAVKAHLLEMSGMRGDAEACYTEAALQAQSLPERRYLESRAARLRIAAT